MNSLIIASANKNKITQIKNMIAPLGIEVKSTADLKLSEPDENGKTYAENATIKSMHAFERSGLPSLADDSGFELEFLNGFPGMVSSRFLNACGDPENAFKILNACLGENKKAAFHTRLAFVYPEGGKVQTEIFRGEISGEFVYPARGSGGFGYCPCFIPNGYQLTFAEMPESLREKINHRAMAVNKFLDFLKSKV